MNGSIWTMRCSSMQLTCEEASDIGAYGVSAPIVIAPTGSMSESLPRPANPTALMARAPELAGHRVFMFMGRVAPIQKGLDLLVQGLALANLPDCRLVILGPDFRGGRATARVPWWTGSAFVRR